MSGYIGYMAIAGIMSLFGTMVSGRLKAKFKKYSQLPSSSGLTGHQVAQKMLDHYGLQDVKVVPARGFLTDHYNPANKTIALSEAVYNQRNIAAAAVAAHECGHAVQHATAYPMLKFRSGIVPLVKVASQMQQFLLMATIGGFVGLGSGIGNTLLLATVVVFGITLLFSVITLPVEFDASKRALVWLDDAGIAEGQEFEGAKDALNAAAQTYVVAALSALAIFIFFLSKYMSSRN